MSTRTGLAIGVMDGVHLGHQSLLTLAREGVDRVVAVTFEPSPAELFAGDDAPKRLTDLPQRAKLLMNHGADEVHVVGFTPDVSAESPEQFVEREIVGALGADRVVVGDNFRFGFKAAGTTDTMRELGDKHGFDVEVAPLFEHDGDVVSSTRIRAALAEHDMHCVATLLGRPFALTGLVVKGEGRGRELGYPTANMQIDPRMAIPPDGIYAGRATTEDGTTALAAISVGTNPTFGDNPRTVEPHLLDFDADLYGQHLTITFEHHVRDQQAFSDVGELTHQIALDVAEARRLGE